MKKYKNKKAFTLIELLTVISIIGLLATGAFVSSNTARKKARDGKRYSDINIIKRALDVYYIDNGQYPEETVVGGDEFEYSYSDPNNFLSDLVDKGYLEETPVDPINRESDGIYYFYKRYLAGAGGCSSSLGAHYVLAISDLEAFDSRPNSKNFMPGCGIYTDFASVYDYIIGDFE